MSAPKIDRTIFFASLVTLVAICIPLFLFPLSSKGIIQSIYDGITAHFGVVYVWTAIAVLAFVVRLAFSKYGGIRLGEGPPQFSTFSWGAMLFCAGVATGILYWGSIEWVYYYLNPPMGAEPRSVEAIEWASTYGMFHWGVSGWAFYILPTIAIGYAYYVRGIPFMRVSASCRALIGDQSTGLGGKLIDILFMAGLLGATGTSLGFGTPMIAACMSKIFGIEDTFSFRVVVIMFCTLIFTVSVYFGLEKGIKRLSNVNIVLAFAFLAFVFTAGPTVFILKMGTNSLGVMTQNFVRMMTWTDPISNTGFVESWTIFYWAWWVAVGPFMGIFVARISRGRTIKQVIWGAMLLGAMGCAVYYAILGNYALSLELNGTLSVTSVLTERGEAAAIAEIIGTLPMGKLVLCVFCVVSLVFMATTFDSTSYALASSASAELKASEEPAVWNRLFWAVSLALLPIALMKVGGNLEALKPLQTAALIVSLPLLVVYGMMSWSLMKSLREDGVKTDP